jgi:hypothetical protein
LDLESYQEEIGISPNVLGPTPNNGVGLFFWSRPGKPSLSASAMRYNRFSVGETDLSATMMLAADAVRKKAPAFAGAFFRAADRRQSNGI